MLDKLTAEMFSEHRNETFWLHSEFAEPLEIKLIEVTCFDPRHSNIRGVPYELREEPFSLLFCGPQEPPLPQSVYRIIHPEMGTIDGLFLVPIGVDTEGRYYETILN